MTHYSPTPVTGSVSVGVSCRADPVRSLQRQHILQIPAKYRYSRWACDYDGLHHGISPVALYLPALQVLLSLLQVASVHSVSDGSWAAFSLGVLSSCWGWV